MKNFLVRLIGWREKMMNLPRQRFNEERKHENGLVKEREEEQDERIRREREQLEKQVKSGENPEQA